MPATIEIEGPYYEWDGGGCFEENEALAEMLAEEGLLFVGGKCGPFFHPEGKDDGQVAIWVNCNDLWLWACADAEPLPMGELQEFYDAWKADPKWGAWKWACKKRGMQPQKPIKRDMAADSAWSEDFEALPEPPPS